MLLMNKLFTSKKKQNIKSISNISGSRDSSIGAPCFSKCFEGPCFSTNILLAALKSMAVSDSTLELSLVRGFKCGCFSKHCNTLSASFTIQSKGKTFESFKILHLNDSNIFPYSEDNCRSTAELVAARSVMFEMFCTASLPITLSIVQITTPVYS